jgi:subtilisin family serine protease
MKGKWTIPFFEWPPRPAGKSRRSLLALVALVLWAGCSRGHAAEEQPAMAQRSPSAADARIAAPRAAAPGVPLERAEQRLKELVLVLGPDAPQETLQYIASISAPREYKATAHESLRSIAKVELGSVRGYSEALCGLNPGLVHGDGDCAAALSAEIPRGARVLVPSITRDKRALKVQIIPGSSVYKQAAPFYESLGPRTMSRIAAANEQVPVLDQVPVGAAVVLPGTTGVQLIRLKPGMNPAVAVAKLSSLPKVQFVELNTRSMLEKPVQVNHLALAASGSNYDVDHLPPNWFISLLGADRITEEDLRFTGRVTVAILDSGLDFSHPAFAGNLWQNPTFNSSAADESQLGLHGYDFATRSANPEDTLGNSHGTHVAGIASARLLAKILKPFSSARLDDHLKLMIMKVTDGSGNLSLDAIASAIWYAQANGARVVSGSWETFPSRSLREYLARYDGMLMVVAAGNGVERNLNGAVVDTGLDIDATPVYPASFKLPNMIAVGAFDPLAGRAYFSNYGANTVNLLAPGVAISSTIRRAMATTDDDPWGTLSGTSQATPFVSLAAALLFAKKPDLNPLAVKQRILDTVEISPDGRGRPGEVRTLNLLKAISIDHDMLELSDQGRTVLRGSILTQDIRFAEAPAACAAAIVLNVRRDRIGRLLGQFEGNTSLLFMGDRQLRGKVCDSAIKIKTRSGMVTKKLAEVRDIVWRGVRGNRLSG